MECEIAHAGLLGSAPVSALWCLRQALRDAHVCQSLLASSDLARGQRVMSPGVQGISNGLVTVWAMVAAPAACATGEMKELVRVPDPAL